MNFDNRPANVHHRRGNTSDSRRIRRRQSRLRATNLDDMLIGVMLLAGPANIIMQLARPAVGYGVIESRVERGRADLHPIKRARTTFTYLAASVAGSAAQKAAVHRAVTDVHALVRSTSESPVQYDARDPELQLWVAACLYRGLIDARRLFFGRVSAEIEERHYRQAMVLATTLEVPPRMWPENSAAFDRYWQASMDEVSIDDAVRDYLYPLTMARAHSLPLPRPLRRWIADRAQLVTTGFLPERFRNEMRLPWDADRERRFNRLMELLRTANRLVPGFVRRFPFNVLLRDLDRRMRTGRRIV